MALPNLLASLVRFSEKQKIILLVCVALIFLGLGVGLAAYKRPAPSPPAPPVQRAATSTPAPLPAAFILDPTAKTVKVGETLSLSLTLTTGSFSVDAVDAILTYDPTVFQATKVVPGKIFGQYPIKQFDNKEGKVQLSAAAQLEENKVAGFSGAGEYGTVSFKALKATDSAQIAFDTNSIAASAGKDRLDLTKGIGGNYQIVQ